MSTGSLGTRDSFPSGRWQLRHVSLKSVTLRQKDSIFFEKRPILKKSPISNGTDDRWNAGSDPLQAELFTALSPCRDSSRAACVHDVVTRATEWHQIGHVVRPATRQGHDVVHLGHWRRTSRSAAIARAPACGRGRRPHRSHESGASRVDETMRVSAPAPALLPRPDVRRNSVLA